MPLSLFLIGPKAYGGLETGATGLAIKTFVMTFLSVNIQLWFNAKFLRLSFWEFIRHQAIIVLLFIVVAAGGSYFVALALPGIHFILQFLAAGIFYSIFVLGLVWLFPWIIALKRSELLELLLKVRNRLPLISAP